MKKFVFVFLSAMLVFAGCSKIEFKNERGWYTDYSECIAAAKKENKKVMMIISSDETDKVSSDLKKKVFYTPEFTELFSPQYLFCEIDISPSLLRSAYPEKNVPPEIKDDEAKSKEFIKEAKKTQNKYRKILDRRMRVFATFHTGVTPTLYLMTKEGFVIGNIPYLPYENAADFAEGISEYNDSIVEIEQIVAEIDSLSGVEKVKKIDILFEKTIPDYRYQLTGLMRQVEKLDPKNETGLVGKYVLAVASSDAIDATFERKQEKVPGIYEKVAKHPLLTDQQKQQALYAEAYVMGTNSPTPEQTKKIISVLEKTIAIDPESNFGLRCKELLVQVQDFQKRQDEYNKKIEEESKEEK